MTDKELRQALGRRYLPAYKAMIPIHDEHEFSPEFESKMRELIGGKKTEKDEQDKPVRASVTHKAGLMIAAVFALVIGIGAAVFLISKSDVLPDDTQPPDAAVQSGSQSSASDKRTKEQVQLEYIKRIAAELSEKPESYYAGIDLNPKDDTIRQKWESESEKAVSSSAKKLGEYLKNADISYLGCTRTKQNYDQPAVTENTVSEDIEKIFSQAGDRNTIWIYPRSYGTALFAKINYTVKDGIGYICISNDILYQYQSEHLSEISYFSFTGSTLPMYSDGQLSLDGWEKDMTITSHNVSRKDFETASFSRSISVHNADSTAGLTYSVDNTKKMPVIKISDIKLPEGETPTNAALELYLCKKQAGSEVLINAAMMSCELKEGQYDLAQYERNIAKQDIDGIRIVMRFDTDKHPSPDKASAQSGLNSAYTITADYCIE